MIRSAGIRSDLLVMTGVSEVETRGDVTVQRTPSEPEYWFGNCLILRRPPTDPEAEVALFRDTFPDAPHVCLEWDIPDLDLGEAAGWFAAHGFDIEHIDFLALDGPIRRGTLPGGLVARPLEAEDWEAALDLMTEIGAEEGYDPARHRAFVAGRNASRRAQIAQGLGQWFGVFDGDLLVAQMGIFVGDGVARYQSVETRASHRRRGICAALLGVAHDWAVARDPSARIVIAVGSEVPAGRIYRRAGFVPFERITAALKPGY